MTGVVVRKPSEGTETHRAEAYVTMEGKIAVMHLQAKEYQGLLTSTRSWEEGWKDSSLELSKRVWPYRTP